MKNEARIRLEWGGRKDRETLESELLHAPPKSGPRLAKTRTAPEPVSVTKSGRLFHGDNVEVMRALLPELRGRVMLAYLDPPFLTGRVHKAIVKGKTLDDRREDAAFDDRWSDRAAYLDSLYARIVLLRELLAPEGSMVLHVDPKTSHYLKVMCDEVFGEDAFASEIVWRYRRWPSKTPNFQRVHDVLLRYRKDPKAPPRFQQLYEPLAASTLATWGTGKQRAVVSATGRRARSSTTETPSQGVPMGDVWDIGVLAPVSKERTGYPTQKPEALLHRIVSALTFEGDLVLDPYSGSGTTLSVAGKLGRQYVGIDASDVAIRTASARLEPRAVRA